MADKLEPIHMLIIDSGYGDVVITRKQTLRAKLKRIWGELTNNYLLSIYGENFIPRYAVDVSGNNSIGGIRNENANGAKGN